MVSKNKNVKKSEVIQQEEGKARVVTERGEDRSHKTSTEIDEEKLSLTMWSSKTTLMFGVAAIALMMFLSSASADDVVALTEETFENEVGKDRAALVEFYAPWYARIVILSSHARPFHYFHYYEL